MMIKGIITCTCGQLFGFETIAETVNCPACEKSYVALDYEIPEEPPVEEVVADGTGI
jgi:hypothetical protein